jgi:uncharacterized protein YjbJ (UPF0337 family)
MRSNSMENGCSLRGELKEEYGKFTDDDLKKSQAITKIVSAKLRNGMATKRMPP